MRSLDVLLVELEGVADVDLGALGNDELCDRAIELGRLRRLVEVAEVRTLRAMQLRSAAEVHACTTARWVGRELGCDQRAVHGRVRDAVRLGERFAETEAAWRAGVISADHVRVILRAANPRIVDAIAELQGELIGRAKELGFERWRRMVAALVYELDADGAFDPEVERERNAAWFSATLDGDCQLRARFDRLTYQRIVHLVDARAKELGEHYQRRADASGGQLSVPGWATLRALAIEELIVQGANGSHPMRSSADTTVVLTPDMAAAGHAGGCSCGGAAGTAGAGGSDGWVRVDLRRGWRAWTLDGMVVPNGPGLAEHLCASAMGALVLDTDGTPLSMGRSVRWFKPWQRRAIAIRDGGCVFPGCDRPPDDCHIHHVDQWERDGGATDVSAGAMLCGRDHGVGHRVGWDVFITSTGWTWFRGPKGSFWGQRHGIIRTGPTADHPDYTGEDDHDRPPVEDADEGSTATPGEPGGGGLDGATRTVGLDANEADADHSVAADGQPAVQVDPTSGGRDCESHPTIEPDAYERDLAGSEPPQPSSARGAGARAGDRGSPPDPADDPPSSFLAAIDAAPRGAADPVPCDWARASRRAGWCGHFVIPNGRDQIPRRVAVQVGLRSPPEDPG